ncbi:mpv17-like protein [Schistocerca americana]|uniref:mpv17-like protein n=1 Tax=Schistocerca americana TaxID=7009 RepID=UPI001F503ECF|nr:mpv17-like protein [Schistocerca americana]XP_047112684.1 mpv17-like protein isoform X2 [Schistocerca piceifrons]XP_049780120.1 mpv17-like protein [Schistocerca cancellata]XP_049808054.1 mpv17-like protein isoform X2 [Schistocerca nitens]XP_049862090.1 mpv17-like protein isoform X2 [Schistocerca gregaria]XP_049957599.1 mpv17-like protein isoform X2 [Schistocerca serialis cubense]
MAARRLFLRFPVLANSLVYGTLYTGAEFSQQTITHKILEKGEPRPYDLRSIGHYGVLGLGFYPQVYYYWYRWLDRRFVGTAAATVLKKMLLDQFVLTPPLLVAFYVSMSLMERKKDLFEECRNKLVPTFKTSCLFWMPAQLVNFMWVPPAARVIYVGSCALVWVNILCWFKRQDY